MNLPNLSHYLKQITRTVKRTYGLLLLFILTAIISSPAKAQWSRLEQFPAQDVTNLVVTKDWLYFSSLDSIYRMAIDDGTISQIGSLGPEIEVWSLDFVGDRLLAGTYDNGVYESIDSGFTWVARNTGLSGVSLAVSCLSSRGDSVYIGTSGAGVYVSSLLSPLSWQPFRDSLGWRVAWSIYSLNQWNNILFIGAGENGYVYRNLPNSTYWEGTPFNENIGGGLAMVDFEFLDSGEIVGAAFNGIYTSNDSGKTWNRFAAPFGSAYYGRTIQIAGEVLTMLGHPSMGSYLWRKVGPTWELHSQLPVAVMTDLEYFDHKLYASSWTGIWSYPLDPTPVDPETPVLPISFELSQNYPNPFNPTTSISFSVPNGGLVELVVYDLLGREVTRLVDKMMPVGNYTVEWDGTDTSGERVASGVYFYKLSSGSFAEARKMLLIK